MLIVHGAATVTLYFTFVVAGVDDKKEGLFW